MLADEQREKLVNAIVYFARHTRYLGITKLCKLLYFLDFAHYKETGRSVTGLEYKAWRMGPVPTEFHREFKRAVRGEARRDLADKLDVRTVRRRDGKVMHAIRPRARFQPDEFTRRELGLLGVLSTVYRNSLARDMVEATHLETEPWYRTLNSQGLNAVIPYDLAVRPEERELIDEMQRSYREALANFGS